MPESRFTIELNQQADFRFEVRFDNPAIPALMTDEPAPLGTDTGPNPARLLAAAVGNCLSASLVFAMRKFKNDPTHLRAVATVDVVRNPQNRLRIGGIDVALHLGQAFAELHSMDRVLAQFEEFCIVTQSVRAGIPVTVSVFDREGVRAGGGQ